MPSLKSAGLTLPVAWAAQCETHERHARPRLHNAAVDAVLCASRACVRRRASLHAGQMQVQRLKQPRGQCGCADYVRTFLAAITTSLRADTDVTRPGATKALTWHSARTTRSSRASMADMLYEFLFLPHLVSFAVDRQPAVQGDKQRENVFGAIFPPTTRSNQDGRCAVSMTALIVVEDSGARARAGESFSSPSTVK